MEWQPIDTAPKDGTEFIGYIGTHGWTDIDVMMWDDYDDWTNIHGDIVGTPTHWMPLPKPPTT